MARFTDRMRAVFGVVWIFSLVFAAQALFADEETEAQDETYSKERLEAFYDIFVCEEKNTTAEVNVTPPCTEMLPVPPGPITACGQVLSPPTIPPLAQQAPSLEYLPIVLINNSGHDVYFTIAGTPETDKCVSSNASYASFGAQPGPFTTTGTTVAATGVNVPPTETYSYKFSDIPQTNGQTVIYIPFLNAATMLFSIDTPLTGLTTGANSISTPPPGDPGDLNNYTKVYGQVEFSFVPTCIGNQITFDYTCVNYYGLSIYLNLYTATPLKGLPNNRPSGIYQSREYILCSLRNAFATASSATASQWQGLVQTSGGKTLRVLAPGTAMTDAPPTFDQNYFDNSAYGFSWANDVWTGTGAYYAKPGNQLSVTTTDGTSYIGKIVSGNFVFQSTTTNEQFSIPWSDTPTGVFDITSSTAIFNTASFFPGMTYSTNKGATSCIIGNTNCCFNAQASCTGTVALDAAATLRGEDITEYLSAAIVAGLIPGKVKKLTPSGFSPNTINNVYYTPNANLNPPGATTGPWYDLYSLGLHGNAAVTGNAVYSYAFDDYLYSQAGFNAQVAPSQATNNATTYITIVIGPYSDN